MARTAETVIENTVQETELTVNSSIPLLSLQFANALMDSEGARDIVLPSRRASEDIGGNSSQQSSSYKVCTGGACNMSETDATVVDASSERGANLVRKTSMSSDDGGDPKQR
jgi:hypothetical protein